jgi:hypothetical protein
MMIKMNKALIIIIIMVMITACTDSKSRKSQSESDIHKVMVEEVMHAAGYTYLLVSEGRKEQWLAVPEMDVNIGTTYYYQGGLNMPNFKSRELDKVFESVIFLEQISLEPPVAPESVSLSDAHSATIPIEKLDISVDVAKDGITITELISEKKSYDGKIVRIRGQVTKYNADIMDKNWIHLQDGTENNGQFDLTITSDLTVKTGDVLTFEGKIALDKDFGFGYFYEIIMEEAKIID